MPAAWHGRRERLGPGWLVPQRYTPQGATPQGNRGTHSGTEALGAVAAAGKTTEDGWRKYHKNFCGSKREKEKKAEKKEVRPTRGT